MLKIIYILKLNWVYYFDNNSFVNIIIMLKLTLKFSLLHKMNKFYTLRTFAFTIVNKRKLRIVSIYADFLSIVSFSFGEILKLFLLIFFILKE